MSVYACFRKSRFLLDIALALALELPVWMKYDVQELIWKWHHCLWRTDGLRLWKNDQLSVPSCILLPLLSFRSLAVAINYIYYTCLSSVSFFSVSFWWLSQPTNREVGVLQQFSVLYFFVRSMAWRHTISGCPKNCDLKRIVSHSIFLSRHAVYDPHANPCQFPFPRNVKVILLV